MSPLGRDIICYLGNTTGEERYEQHSFLCLSNSYTPPWGVVVLHICVGRARPHPGRDITVI